MTSLAAPLSRLSQSGLQAYERYGRYLPPALSLLLVAAIAWTLAGLLWSLVPLPEAAQWRPAPVAAAPGSSASRGPDISVITNARMFGELAALAPADADLSAAPDTSLSLTLLGILAGNTDLDSRALIGTQTGEEQPYSIGEDITRGVSLHAIFPDRVVLSRNGSFETLRLEKDKPSTASVDGPPPQASVVDTAAAPAQMLAQVREQILADPSKTSEYIRVQPSNAGGQLKGYRIYPGRDRSMFNNVGLRPGDLVTAVNGIQLDDGQKALQTLNELKQASSVTLTLERGGQVQTVNVSLN